MKQVYSAYRRGVGLVQPRHDLLGLKGIMTIADRAANILRDEIANGALANIDASSRIWSAPRSSAVVAEATRTFRNEFKPWLDSVLDLIAPLQRQIPMPTLRSGRHVSAGQVAEILTRLQNDTRHAIDIALECSDLVAESDRRIHAGKMHLSPPRVQVPARATIDLAIRLSLPADAEPGVYHGVLCTPDIAGLTALLTVSVT